MSLPPPPAPLRPSAAPAAPSAPPAPPAPPAPSSALRVRDLMTRNVFTLSATQSVPLAEAMMSLKHIRHVPIVDDAGHLQGLVTHRDLLAACISTLSPLSDEERSSLQLSVPVSRLMRRDVWTISSLAPASAAARLMRDHQIGCLPVVDDGVLVGILTGTDLLELASRALESVAAPRAGWRVEDAMTAVPLSIEPSTTIEKARSVMLRFGIRHLPVVEGGRPIALVADADLRVAEVVYRECGQKTQASLATYFCGGERLHRTTPEAHLDDVLLDMWRSRLDATLVVSASDGALVGILTTADACRLFGEHLASLRAAARRPGVADEAPGG
ncbi:MAG: CBS domain-containing protein [Myxococcales bacterium]|nr:CBS domain-containing protein [Myxococcales bacterium]